MMLSELLKQGGRISDKGMSFECVHPLVATESD